MSNHMFLYNGVELPALPKWDREAYPFAFIYRRYTIAIRGYVSDLVALSEVTYQYMSNGKWALYVDADADRLGWQFEEGGEAQNDGWKARESAWYGYVGMGTVTWANFDVRNEDGSVTLDASDPVPGQEFAGILKRSFWQGFASGVGTIHKAQEQQEPEIIATLEDGVLYIQKAPATLNGNTLEVG